MNIDRRQLSPAEQLLWGYGVTDPSHIDLVAIANDKGAEVKFRPLGGCEARLVARGDSAIISVSSTSSQGRQRFSLAHELAHWICDRDRGVFLCAKEDIGPQNSEAKSVEGHANNYASQLILPTYLVDPWLKGRRANLDVANQLSKEFSCSLTAAAINTSTSSLVYAYLFIFSLLILLSTGTSVKGNSVISCLIMIDRFFYIYYYYYIKVVNCMWTHTYLSRGKVGIVNIYDSISLHILSTISVYCSSRCTNNF